MSPPHSKVDRNGSVSITERMLILALLVAYLLFLLKAPWRSSLWLDETISLWLISQPWSQLIENAVRFQGQSPLYFLLLKTWSLLFGASELALRGLSVLLFTAALAAVVALGRRWISRECGWLAALLWLGMDVANIAALSARPYALSLLASLCFVLVVDRWLLTGRKTLLTISVLLLLLTFYSHYLFAGIIVVPLLQMAVGHRNVPPLEKPLVVFAVLAGVLALPGVKQLASLGGRREELSFVESPDVLLFAQTVLPLYVVLYLCTGLLMALIFGVGRGLSLRLERRISLVLVGWFLCPPLLFFLVSQFGGMSLFVARLFAWHQPALCLFLAYVFLAVIPAAARRPLLASVVALVVSREAMRKRYLEPWREVVQIAHEAESREMPIFLFSGLIESDRLEWYADEVASEYLAAPFTVYQGASSVLLPADLSKAEALTYLNEKVQPLLASKGGLLIFYRIKQRGINGQPGYVHESYKDFFSSRGLALEEVVLSNSKSLVAFMVKAKV